MKYWKVEVYWKIINSAFADLEHRSVQSNEFSLQNQKSWWHWKKKNAVKAKRESLET